MKTRRNNNAEFLCLHLHGIRCVRFCKDDYGDKKETHPPQKSPQTIIHKIKGEIIMKKVYVTITGMKYYYGFKDKYSEEKTEQRDKIEEKEVVKF